jgi:cyclopropane fatty-acyl-phospholipid synthase-like methyltransferase
VNIALPDYRDLPARFGDASFDKVASGGMFEHVGLRNLGACFGIVPRMLRERGLFPNHAIASSDVNHRQVGERAAPTIAPSARLSAWRRPDPGRHAWAADPQP